MTKLQQYFKNTGVMKVFFANKIGATPTSLSAWLHGRTVPNIDFAFRIEKATNGFVKAQDWLTEEIK